MKALKWLIFQLVLRPIIWRDYALRKAGKRPDEWHPADLLALRWGYTVPWPIGLRVPVARRG